METIYKWQIEKYDWDLWILFIDNDYFYINEVNLWKIKWLRSKKWQIYWRKESNNLVERFEFILFENGYIIILHKQLEVKQTNDIEFPDGRYPALWL